MTIQPESTPLKSPRESLLVGRYRLLELIGEGGAAEVFRAWDERLDRAVAVKLLRPQFTNDPSSRERFTVEARAAAGLSFPNIVTVYDFGTAGDGRLFIAMQYVEGRDLKQLLLERGPLPVGQATAIARQVCAALTAAHERGLIHRDVKPQNILIDAAGTVRLTDFGIVKALAGSVALTQAGTTFGTAAYLSPEQAMGERVGPATDLYSLGAVMYETLAGRPPFVGENPASVAYKQVWEEPPPLRQLAPSVPRDLERIVMRCLRKPPAERYGSAAELEADLRRVGASADGAAVPALAALGAAADRTSEQETEQAAVAREMLPASQRTSAYGLVTGTPASARVRTRRRPAGADTNVPLPLVALLALAVLAFGGWLLIGAPGVSDGDPSASRRVGGAAATATPRRASATPRPSSAARRTPSPTPAPTENPEPTEPPTATPAPTPNATPAPPTPTPAAATATPAPVPGDAQSVRIADSAFRGGFTDADGRYHGRSARWVYGRGTAYHTMTASFRVAGEPNGTATLRIVGLDSEDAPKTPMRLVLNDTVLFEGPNPLPNDTCCGSGGAGNWGAVELRFPARLLREGTNTLTVSNLDPSARIYFPIFVMVDEARLTYRAR